MSEGAVAAHIAIQLCGSPGWGSLTGSRLFIAALIPVFNVGFQCRLSMPVFNVGGAIWTVRRAFDSRNTINLSFSGRGRFLTMIVRHRVK